MQKIVQNKWQGMEQTLECTRGLQYLERHCFSNLINSLLSSFFVEFSCFKRFSLSYPVEEKRVYAQHLSKEKFRGGCLNKKGILWDGYPLRLFLINFSNMHTISNFLILFLHAEYSLRECKNKIGKKSGFTFLSLNSSNLVKFNIQNQSL